MTSFTASDANDKKVLSDNLEEQETKAALIYRLS